MAGLSDVQQEIADDLVRALARIDGVVAVVLGGSFARGTARQGSDIDLGVYYYEGRPFSLEAVRALAARRNDLPEPVVTDFFEWGPWVNGGAWLVVRGQRVDLLWRSIEHVERVIEAAERGQVDWHFEQQPPYGYASPMYLSETADCRPLHDPDAVLAALKRRVATYPEPLARGVIVGRLRSVQFALGAARKYAAEGDVYSTAGCLTRASNALAHALFAINRIYFASEKSALVEIDRFALSPADFGSRIEDLLARPGRTAEALGRAVEALALLYAETRALAGPAYTEDRALAQRLG